MSIGIKESDWKTFRDVRALALERFCKNILDVWRRLADGDGKGAHEKYLAIYKLIHERDEEIAAAFNGLSRSAAFRQLELICSYGVVTDEELKKFSPELRAELRDFFPKERRTQ
jgi:hypothetical protein